MQLLTNHIGYQVGANKVAVIKAKAGLVMSPASLVSCQDKSVCFTAEIVPHGRVDHWSDWYFYQIDFSDFDQQGQFEIAVESEGQVFTSHVFSIADELLLNRTLSDNLFYFKGQRSSGHFDKADQNLPFWGDDKRTADVRGGWFDASGDMSKYLSHLSFSNYLNPQQIPMVAWNLIRSYRVLSASDNIIKVNLNKRILDEGLSVREVEAMAKAPEDKTPPKSPGRRPMSFEQQRFKSGLSELLGKHISLKVDPKGKGSITIPFEDEEDLRRIAHVLDI